METTGEWGGEPGEGKGEGLLLVRDNIDRMVRSEARSRKRPTKHYFIYTKCATLVERVHECFSSSWSPGRRFQLFDFFETQQQGKLLASLRLAISHLPPILRKYGSS
jgi:hypothetical protein